MNVYYRCNKLQTASAGCMRKLSYILSMVLICCSCSQAEANSIFVDDIESKKWQMLCAFLLAVYMILIPLVGWLVGEIKHRQLQKMFRREMLSYKHLRTHQLETEQQNKELLSLQQKLKEDNQQYLQLRVRHIENNCRALRHSVDWKADICWGNFSGMCEIINTYFFLLVNKLRLCCDLQEKEIRLCVLVLLDMFDSRQMADLLSYSESGIRNYKHRIAQKLGTTSKDLRAFLVNLAAGGEINSVNF